MHTFWYLNCFEHLVLHLGIIVNVIVSIYIRLPIRHLAAMNQDYFRFHLSHIACVYLAASNSLLLPED